VPASAFVDRRAAEPIIYIPEDVSRAASWEIRSADPSIAAGEQAAIDYTPDEFEFPLLPNAALVAPEIAEPFALELWAEKSTMNDVLVAHCGKSWRWLGDVVLTGV
jgi:hypothetical protein